MRREGRGQRVGLERERERDRVGDRERISALL